MSLLRIENLPADALNAASTFHGRELPRVIATLGESRGDLLLVFPPADHTHTAWRRAVVQGLARRTAPRRLNAIVTQSEAAIAAAQSYLAAAPGVTGQLLALDDAGAGPVLGLQP